MKRLSLLSILLLPALLSGGGLHDEIPFVKHTVDLGAAEACAVTDVNGDGVLDIVAGENWFQGPNWKRRPFRELKYERNYLDDFSELIVDVNGDGRPDVASATWFSRELAWYENPGQTGPAWKKHVFDSGNPTEFAFLVDIDNDGRAREILPQFGGRKAILAWYSVENGRLVRHVVSEQGYGHGIGAGDVNGDGRTDILTPAGWWEAPPDPKNGKWTHHEDFAKFEFPQLGFMAVRQIGGDQRGDVVTTFAHGRGVIWLEQGDNGQWTKHVIDESWSQPHAFTLVDLNGDNQLDLVTGKRFHAHNGRDEGGNEPLGLYWYEHRKKPDGTLLWKRHVIDYGTRTGGGMQIPVVDIDKDGDLDIVAPGKGGLFLFENKTR